MTSLGLELELEPHPLGRILLAETDMSLRDCMG